MPTRFYLPSSGSPIPALSPAFDSAWEDTSIAARLRTRTVKSSTAMTTVSFSDTDATSRDILFRQYISDPIVAVSIVNPAVEFQIRGFETDPTNTLFTALHVRVVQANGSLRGTILAVTRDTIELNETQLQNRRFTNSPTVTISAQDGDRLVFELGYGGNPNVGHDGDLRFGDSDAVDLPENDTETADNNPWIELSTTILFLPEADESKRNVQLTQNVIRLPNKVVGY